MRFYTKKIKVRIYTKKCSNIKMEIKAKHSPITCEFTCAGPWEEKAVIDVDMCNKTSKRLPNGIFTVLLLKTFVKIGSKTLDDAVIEFEELLPEQYRPLTDILFTIQTCHLNNTNNGKILITTGGKIIICATDTNINGGKYKPGDFPQGFYETKIQYLSKFV